MSKSLKEDLLVLHLINNGTKNLGGFWGHKPRVEILKVIRLFTRCYTR